MNSTVPRSYEGLSSPDRRTPPSQSRLGTNSYGFRQPPPDRDRPVNRRIAQSNRPATTFVQPTPSHVYTSRGEDRSTVRYTKVVNPGNRSININQQWKDKPFLTIAVMGLPRSVMTVDVYHILSQYGTVSSIHIVTNSQYPDAKAIVTFSPPPVHAFWRTQTLQYEFEGEDDDDAHPLKIEESHSNKTGYVRSPVNNQRRYPERTTLIIESLDFGIMYAEDKLMTMQTITSDGAQAVRLTIDLNHKEFHVDFSMRFGFRNSQYRFRIPFAQVERIYECKLENKAHRALIFPIDSPPEFFRYTDDIDATHDPRAARWNDNRAWIRQTDIVLDKASLAKTPVKLRRDGAIIDIGRWTAYKFVIKSTPEHHMLRNRLQDITADFNIPLITNEHIESIPRREPAIWSLIEPKASGTGGTDDASSMLQQMMTGGLSFPVRYQLEVCLSQGYLNEHNMTLEFYEKLTTLEPDRARMLLERIADMRRRVYDPMEVFNLATAAGKGNVPRYCALTRSATITPTTIYFNTPTVETSNRIIRAYREMEDRFLRVKFTDESSRGRVYAKDDDTQDEVFQRIKNAMLNGITLGDRHYEFLAFGNSQFRENGAYFFASTPHLKAAEIRRDMGDLNSVNVVSKWASKLGLNFSTTRAINGTKVKIVRGPDIERNGYCFTDGVGKISVFLAQMIAAEFGLPDSVEEVPSLFQFRLGGCKGVLAIDPKLPPREIFIRASQHKFTARHEGLEVIRVSSFATAMLNRQLIIVLSTLGVPDECFLDKLRNELTGLNQAMAEGKKALELLQKNIDFNQTTLMMASMVLDGFMEASDPFMMSVLQLWRAWNIKNLKERARIPIHEGAFLLGCVDETRTLRGHEDFDDQDEEFPTMDPRLKNLPEIFLQIPDLERKGKYKVIEGICILARNPSLHPGDLRVVRAVYNKDLLHLRNVVVLPQRGTRPVANMCSGGDLDGDDYLISWDPSMLPEEWNHPPMDYTAPEPIPLDRQVHINDVIDFFATYMQNDQLPRIAHAHLGMADFAEAGVKDEKCLELAQLHSNAVDYPKSGIPARMGPHLRVPRWPHFMEKKVQSHKEYHSGKVLGKLFDEVQTVDFQPQYELPFDERVLNAYELDDAILADAEEVKKDYDSAMRRILAQHSINSEFEVWSSFVLAHNFEKRDYTFQEEIGRIMQALNDRFRQVCAEKAGGSDFDHFGPFIAALYTVTARQIKQALEECCMTKTVGGREVPVRKMDAKHMPLMSLPWLFVAEMGKIATRDANRPYGPVAQQGAKKKGLHRKKGFGYVEGQDDIETEEGVTHRGEMLRLFDNSPLAEEETGRLVDIEDFDHAAKVDEGISGPKAEPRRRPAYTKLFESGDGTERWGEVEEALVVDEDDLLSDDEYDKRKATYDNPEPEVDLLDYGEEEVRLPGDPAPMDTLSAMNPLPSMPLFNANSPSDNRGPLTVRNPDEKAVTPRLEIDSETIRAVNFNHQSSIQPILTPTIEPLHIGSPLFSFHQGTNQASLSLPIRSSSASMPTAAGKRASSSSEEAPPTSGSLNGYETIPTPLTPSEDDEEEEDGEEEVQIVLDEPTGLDKLGKLLG